MTQIGDLCWFAENLRAAHFLNGDSIEASVIPYPIASYPITDLEEEFGRIYQIDAVLDSRQLCPSGWHTSTWLDWTYTYELMSNQAGAFIEPGNVNDGTGTWNYEPDCAFNTTGFSLKATGYFTGGYYERGSTGTFWMDTGSSYADIESFNSGCSAGGGPGTAYAGQSTGSFVRCVRD